MGRAVDIFNHADTILNVNLPAFCTRFSALQAHLPRTIHPHELSDSLELLLQYPYLEIINELQDIAFDNGRTLPLAKLSRLERVLQRARTDSTLPVIMNQGLPQGYHFVRIQQGADYRTVLEMMRAILNCIKAEEQEEAAKRIQADIDLGGCVKLFGLDAQGTPRIYLRYYVAIDKNGKPLLQIDAVEGGTKSYWTEVGQWAAAGRGKELLYGISTSLMVTKTLGLQNIVLGDFESDELGNILGCRRVQVYGLKITERKIGLPPRIVLKEINTGQERVVSPGVFANRLTEDARQRVLCLSYQGLPVSEIYEHASQACADGNKYRYLERKLRELKLLTEATGALQSGLYFPANPFHLVT